MCKKPESRGREAYLSSFLSEFDYPAEARIALGEAYARIFADPSAVRAFEKVRRKFERNPDGKFSFFIETSDAIAEKCALSRFTVYLLFLILLSESAKKVYAARKISPQMWHDNMLDLKYTADLCSVMKGVQGTYCPDWYRRFFAATRFTFGRLQFETGRLGKPYEKEGVKLDPDASVIYIHIPRTGERLLPADVDAACAAASAFYRERFGVTQTVFACHSWLLYPENKKILSEKSNLYSFISRFEVIDVTEDTEYKELWRLFDREYDGDVDALPQDTSLRRAYAQRVKEHLPLGDALGVWIYREQTPHTSV